MWFINKEDGLFGFTKDGLNQLADAQFRVRQSRIATFRSRSAMLTNPLRSKICANSSTS